MAGARRRTTSNLAVAGDRLLLQASASWTSVSGDEARGFLSEQCGPWSRILERCLSWWESDPDAPRGFAATDTHPPTCPPGLYTAAGSFGLTAEGGLLGTLATANGHALTAIGAVGRALAEGVERWAGTACQATGALAAGTSASAARRRARLELIERDAFCRVWAARTPARTPPGHHAVRWVDWYRRRGVSISFHALPSEAAQVVLCLGRGDGREWPAAVVGLGASRDVAPAARHAILEMAHSASYLARRLRGEIKGPDLKASPHGAFRYAVDDGGAFDFLVRPEEPPSKSRDRLGARTSLLRVHALRGGPFVVARAESEECVGLAELRVGQWSHPGFVEALRGRDPNPDPDPLL